ncbi:MAG: sugar transferase [Planctomycetota bacterium]|jgi:exopolysaccharide biosynthesis polyprenyl glycosylphosphotransferase
MSRLQHHRPIRIAIDLGMLLAALSLAGCWSGHAGESSHQIVSEIVGLWLLFAVIWLAIGSRLGVYQVSPSRNLGAAMRRGLEAWAATWGLAGLVAVSTFTHAEFSIWLTLIYGALGTCLGRLAIAAAAPREPGARALIVGACPSARALSNSVTESGLEVVGVVPFTGEDATQMAPLPTIGAVAELPTLLRELDVEVALVSPSDSAVTGELHRVFQTCDELELAVQYFPSFLDVDHRRIGMTWNAARPGLSLQTIHAPSLSQLLKRAIDIVGSAAGILLLLPVFVACAIGVKLSSPGPVFFRQQRVGKSGRTFGCLKFRTMRVGAQAQQELLRSNSLQDGPAFKMAKDPRITGIGRILRKFSLDELPQLLNVLIGDMSIVGPRPPIPTEVEKYTWWQRRRISVKPGLTCVWQVYGRNRVSFKRWVEMDLYYIDNWSLWLDLKLIAHTVRVVLRGTGM